ncbi:NTP transferase domain-containing protein [bacterium]|nr:NTP transferase domain-containing protein [bacterium]
MKAIILAAGKGIRFQPLSITRPKPLIKLFGTTLLEHNLEQLRGIAKEVILVIGCKGELIQEKIGRSFKEIKIKYVWQKDQLGTGDAALLASKFITDKFLLLNGDDLYFQEDIKNLMKNFPSISSKQVTNPENFGVVIEKNKKVIKLTEKPKDPQSNLVNTGLYFLPKTIFRHKIKRSQRGEYEFTDYIKEFIKKNDLKVSIAKYWVPMPYFWNLLDATDVLFRKAQSINNSKKERGIHIEGKVVIKKGTVLRSGTYIIGPVYIGENCVIGPNCFIRGNTVIGDNCHIGQAVEIKNSIIGDNTNIRHLSYVGDSIIGENCNLGAGTIIANLRHDNATIKTMINGELIDTKRRKFGTVFGDGVKTGIGTLVYPGRKIWPNKTTLPGEIVKKDKDIK